MEVTDLGSRSVPFQGLHQSLPENRGGSWDTALKPTHSQPGPIRLSKALTGPQ